MRGCSRLRLLWCTSWTARRAHGAELAGEVARYGDSYRYCYIHGPEGIIIGLVQELR